MDVTTGGGYADGVEGTKKKAAGSLDYPRAYGGEEGEGQGGVGYGGGGRLYLGQLGASFTSGRVRAPSLIQRVHGD